ncbi:MAG: hypothetical protein SFY68_02255 [Candidatus Sumerlaeia bacterium]|nr:hypothetical protein [Candidatus Sumerlaeia bacterium]
MAEVVLSEFLKSMSGSLGAVTFRNTKNGIVLSSRPDRRRGEGTLEQQRARQLFTLVATSWPSLTDAQREQWEAYAVASFPEDKDGRGAGPNGQAVFNKLNWYRLVLGQTILTSVPGSSRPSPLVSLSLTESGAEDELNFTVQHQARVGVDRLLVEATSALRPGALRVQEGEYKLVRGLNGGSFALVAAPGSEYRFSGIRFPVPAGRRFALRVSVVSPEGLVSSAVGGVYTKVIQ